MATDAPPSSEALLRSLPDPVVFVDASGTIVEVTDRIAEIGGWSRDRLVGSTYIELFPDRIRAEVARTFNRWLTEGHSSLQHRSVRLPALAADGTEFELELRIDRLDGGFVAVIRNARDPSSGLRAGLLDAVSAESVTADTISSVLDRIGTAFPWDVMTLWGVDDQTGTLRPIVVWEREPDHERVYRSATLRQPFTMGEGLPGAVWQEARTRWVTDLDQDPRFQRAEFGQNRPRCGAFVPVRVGHRVVGVLEVLACHPVDAELWLESEMVEIGAPLGQLVERFHEQQATEHAEGRLALALDAGQFGVWTLDSRSGFVQWSARMAELHGLPSGSGQGRIDDILVNVHADDLDELRGAIDRALTSDDPLTVHYRVVGDELHWVASRITGVRNAASPALVSGVVSDITEQKRAELSARRRTMAIEGLQWVSQAIIAGRELTDTAVSVAHAATGVLGAELGVVLYPEPGEVSDALAWAVSGIPGDVDIPDPPQAIRPPLGIADSAEVRLIPDLRHADEARDFLHQLGLPIDPATFRSLMLVPIRGDGGRGLGVMAFAHHELDYFTDDDARLASSIGTSTGVAIENAQRHEQQRLAAMTFQRQLLPAEVEFEGVELCVRYHPGRDGLDVGGDWYDVMELDDHRIGVAVGDVCGHGLTAAAHMGQFRYSFRALVQSSSSPRKAFAMVNRLALQELGTTLTLAYVEIDTRTGKCRSWRCGHLPPVVVGAGGDHVRWLDDDRRGPMLGFVEDFEIDPCTTVLEPGELLLLYTDGLVERRNESIDEGMARLAAAFEGRSGLLETVCDELYHVLADIGPEADDTALLAVRRQ